MHFLYQPDGLRFHNVFVSTDAKGAQERTLSVEYGHHWIVFYHCGSELMAAQYTFPKRVGFSVDGEDPQISFRVSNRLVLLFDRSQHNR